MSSDYDFDITQVQTGEIGGLNDDQFKALLSKTLNTYQNDKKEAQLLYYCPASPDSEKLHASDAMIRWGFGGNRCIPLHAEVFMSDGSKKPLGEVRPGDRVLAADPKTRQTHPSTVVRTYRSGRKPVFRVTFSDGGSFEATAEHEVPLYLGSGSMTSKGKPKIPHKRRLGEYIEPIQRRGSTNPSKRISAVSPSDIRSDTECKLRIHPYLLGALIGDGSFTKRPSISFHNIDQDVIARVRRHVETMGLELVRWTHGVEYGIRGMHKSHTLRLEADRLDLWKRDWFKSIPEECFALPRYMRMELLAGLIDTDGSIDWFVSSSKELSEGFQRLVHSLGGKATIHKKRTPSKRGLAWGVYWRMNERVPLSRADKQSQDGKRAVDYSRRVCRDAEFVGWFECGDIEVDHPAHCYLTGDRVIVSNSGKSESCLVECMIQATGVIPDYLRERYEEKYLKQLRGPVNGRIVCQSLSNVLEPTILPKLRWSSWSGSDEVGGDKGHWGWIPRMCLIDGEWDRSWSPKSRTLRLLYRDPKNIDRIIGESIVQFFSYDQKPEDFASAHCHFVMFDEPPPEPIYSENKMRVMSARGWLIGAMTWPDDPSINVDWLFDEIYEKGTPGPKKDPHYECFTLRTIDNIHLDQEYVQETMDTMDERKKKVRIYGEHIRFSNRVHELFTDTPRTFCFVCGEDRVMDLGKCTVCDSDRITTYCHVEDFAWNHNWPVYWIVDPHPRKDHMSAWVGIDPGGDWKMIAELLCPGDIGDLKAMKEDVEASMGLRTVRMLIDPRMASSPTGTQRERSWMDDFHAAGLYVDGADPGEVGRKTIDAMLRPDENSGRPRFTIHPRCPTAILQFQRFMWDDWKAGSDRSQKQRVKEKYDDFPAIMRYFANEDASFEGLMNIGGGMMRTGRYRRYPGRRVA